MTGLKRTFMLVFTWTWRTQPLLSSWITGPIIHEFRGAESSTTGIISPTLIFLSGRDHFCLSCKLGKYSLVQRFQNKSAKYWTWCHLRLEWISFHSPGGNNNLAFNNNKWFGVKPPGLSTEASTARLLEIHSNLNTSQSSCLLLTCGWPQAVINIEIQ